MDSLDALWRDPFSQTLLGLLIVLVLAWLASVLTRFVLFRLVRRIALRTSWSWDDALFQHGSFDWVARMAPALVLLLGIKLVPRLPPEVAILIGHVALASLVLFVAMAFSRGLTALEAVYRQGPHAQQRSIKGLLQLAKLAVFIVGALVVIGAVTGKNIGLLLSGVGAMSAVLILIFKDTILGFVAGVQLSSNDMLRVGDWITMPGAGADGDVIDISLYTVEVRNFDKTIVTIPTWKMIAESYQNWRGMVESGGRRIKRPLYLDATSVGFLEAEQIERLLGLRLLREYLDGKRADLERWNQGLGEAASALANRRRLTNIGTFRAYVEAYLKQHESIHREMTCMARQLDSGAQGVPIELYCFTNTTAWAVYEGIQSDIFDHLLAILPEFGLRLFQQPSGHDVRAALAVVPSQAAESALVSSR